MDGANELVVLARNECLALLRARAIGRVVFTDAALPSAQPVNYLLDDEEIIFRTANGARLAVATRTAVVAFEVDDIDHVTRTGWSVLGVGKAYEVVDPARLAALAELHTDPWAPGHTAHTISIPLQILSGRRLVPRAPSPCDDRHAPGCLPDDRDHQGHGNRP
jgi:nitroimidazol reductase NimA-like FMN-containing flavoprotein (pyridoxamine 5'-phosphate oxidase superfamily)